MKTVFGLVAALICGSASNAQAQASFVGGEAGVATYPGYTGIVMQYSTMFGIYGGQWLSKNWGWEAAIADLGSIHATGTGAAGHKHAAAALSAAALGGFDLGKGTVFGKLGLYRASVKSDGPTLSVTTSTTDFVIGGGYSMSLAEHLVGKIELNIYNNVRFQRASAPAGTTDSSTINKLSVGMAYTF